MTDWAQKSRVDKRLIQWESMRADRQDFDRKWQLVSDYILPRRDFSITQRPNQLRPHRVTSSVATNANTRMATLVLAYWFDPTRPNLLPNVKRGLAVAGRNTELDDDGINYCGDLAWNVWDHMVRPKARLMMHSGSMLKEFCAFGCGVLWTGRRRGFGPYYNGRALSASWWSCNEEGVIDTFYYLMKQPLYRVLERWPETAPPLYTETRDRNENVLVDILLTCQPRPGGRPGAVVEAKPFEFLAIAVGKGAVLEESGYDSFPYSVFRYDPMPSQTYAEGPGCQVLPDVMVLNHLQEAVENVASQKAAPPLAVPARMFGKTLDRRPGALNAYNPAGLGLQRADQAIIKLDMTGDPSECVALIQELTNTIETGFFVDWLRLRETGDMTAEEVSERRDMRLRGMASIVANLEEPTSALGDRTMEVMLAEGAIPPAPGSVAGADVDWEYAGPLQIAQLRGNVQSLLQLMNARGLALEQDPDAAEAIDLESCLRSIHSGLGAPEGVLMSKAFVERKRQARQHALQQQQDAEKLAQVAGAAKSGGAGIASVMGAMQGAGQGGGAPGPGGAPFAPAAPLAQPLAA